MCWIKISPWILRFLRAFSTSTTFDISFDTDAGRVLPNLSRESIFSGTNGERENLFPYSAHHRQAGWQSS